MSEKQCNRCLKILPIEQFPPSKTNRGGLRHQCKECVQKRRLAFYHLHPEIRAESQRKWKQKNPGYIRNYMREYYRKNPDKFKSSYRKVVHPDPERCHCGNETKFFWMGGKWNCIPCVAKAASKRHRINARKRSLFKRFGKPIVDVYSRYMEHPNSRPDVSLIHLYRISMPVDYQKLGERALKKIHLMNRIQKSTIGNIGWRCEKCGICNGDHRFFDLDHKLPRHKGGKGKGNLQILCPNCHREKTLLDLGRTPIGVLPDKTGSFFESTSTARSPVEPGGP